jgi:hypothetical protein
MAWRVHLNDRPIRRLDLLPGKPSILAAWLSSQHVVFLDLQTGSKRGEKTFDPFDAEQRASDAWREFVGTLTASNGAILPSVRVGSTTLLSSSDGSTLLIRTGARQLFQEQNDIETALAVDDTVTAFAAVDMDRNTGLIAALDQAGKLHRYQQTVKLIPIDTHLSIEPEQRPDVAVVNHGGSIFVTDGQHVMLYGASGAPRQRLDLHFTFGAMRASADGRLLVITDLDAGVIRIFNGETLAPTHQRFGVDLLADAKRLLLTTPGPASPGGALGALAVNTRGVVAFSVGGSVCVTNLARFKPLPGIAPAVDEDDDARSIDAAASFFPETPPDAESALNF